VKRWLPFPIMSAFLFCMWLLLNQTLEPAHVLFALLAAWALPWWFRGLQPIRADQVRKPWLIITLFVKVFHDICVSAWDVSVVILGAHWRRQHSGFMTIPMDMKSPHGLAVLACIINSTPGTVWAELTDDRCYLMIHVLDLRDEEAWCKLIKERYEQPLMEIFGS